MPSNKPTGIIVFLFLAPIGVALFCALAGVAVLAGKFLVFAIGL